MRELSELEVLIVDCQTTGATPAHGVVLELGWCRVKPSRTELEALQAYWVKLPPGEKVSSHVRRLTGFDERLQSSALEPEVVWGRLRESLAPPLPMPAAIHFARFEVTFLRDWAERFAAHEPFPVDAVCVHAIACRLYPQLPRRGLRALSGYLGHGLDLTRRALGHVEATAFVWRKLTDELAARGVYTWDALSSWLAAPAAQSSRSSKRRYPLPSARYRALPDQAGVYRFLRSNGDVLYVGKAASLRKRVASHFKASGSTEQALEMLTQTQDIAVTLAPTALEAALLENETIKALRPPYNVHLTGRDTRVWFSTPGFDAEATMPDAACRLGPLPAAYCLRPLGALLALCSGEPVTRRLKARAVGAAELWAPDDAVFEAGFSEFRQRHLAEATSEASASVRRKVFAAAKKLLLLSSSAQKPEAPDAAEAEEDTDAAAEGGWDPARVTRHLERAAAQAYRLLRRARWLCLLQDSAVVYWEPGSERARVLWVTAGALLEAQDLAQAPVESGPPRTRPLSARQASFDRAQYDRLRVLTSELKRVLRDGGSVSLYLARRRFSGAALARMLCWV